MKLVGKVRCWIIWKLLWLHIQYDVLRKLFSAIFLFNETTFHIQSNTSEKLNCHLARKQLAKSIEQLSMGKNIHFASYNISRSDQRKWMINDEKVLFLHFSFATYEMEWYIWKSSQIVDAAFVVRSEWKYRDSVAPIENIWEINSSFLR